MSRKLNDLLKSVSEVDVGSRKPLDEFGESLKGAQISL